MLTRPNHSKEVKPMVSRISKTMISLLRFSAASASLAQTSTGTIVDRVEENDAAKTFVRTFPSHRPRLQEH